jgi:pimeloyl-ACP methyl ester carboxylesterase
MTAVYRSVEGGRDLERRYREFLDRWPVPAEQMRVPTREGDAFVVACGPAAAPPLLLLHGSGTNTAMWRGDVAEWARHFRVYCVDLLGEPGLSAPARPPLASGAYGRWLDEVIETLEPARGVSIVGASLGAWVALDHATRRPDGVERLVLLCPGGIGRQKVGSVIKAMFLLMLGGWGRRKALDLIMGWTPAGSAPQGQVSDDADLDAFMDYTARVFRDFRPGREKLPIFGDDALRALTMPVLVIVGGRDVMLDSRDTMRRVERAVPHATVRLLPEAGHGLRGQTAPILDFLRTPTPSDG